MIKIFRKLTFLIIVATAVCACSRSLMVTDSVMEDAVRPYFTKEYAENICSSGDFSILYRKQKNFAELFQDLYFVVYDHAQQEVILSDTLWAGQVDWISENEIRAISRDYVVGGGRVRVSYTYNASTNAKTLE